MMRATAPNRLPLLRRLRRQGSVTYASFRMQEKELVGDFSMVKWFL